MSPGVVAGAPSALIVIEVTLMVALLTGAGLLLRSLGNAALADPGFDPGRVHAVDLSLPRTTYDVQPRRAAFVNALLARLRAVPGVEPRASGSPCRSAAAPSASISVV